MAELSQERQVPVERAEPRRMFPNGVLVGGRVRLDPVSFGPVWSASAARRSAVSSTPVMPGSLNSGGPGWRTSGRF
jgi:hypothetical protein